MMHDYSHFKAADFLNDDFFIESMLHPNASSEAFWKTFTNDEKNDCDEFLTAYMTLKRLHENKPEAPVDRIQLLWERIEQSKKQVSTKKNRIAKRKWFYYAAACIAAGIAIFSLYTLIYNTTTSYSETITPDKTEYITIHNQEQTASIQITTGANTLTIDGQHVDVEYDEEGNMKVNDQVLTHSANKQDSIVLSQLSVPYGKRAQITLSDGTVLWVNTGTTVLYPVTFAREKREIYVEGEVYASVMHNKSRPFIIKTKKLDVVVTGTELNVTAYNEDNKIDVVLVDGVVNIKLPKGEPALMQPNHCFTYTDEACTLYPVDVENYTHWRKGALLLKREPVENILLRLARYYNVTMKLPASVSGITCSGKIELKDDLDEVLSGLSEITSMQYAVKDNSYQFKFN